MGALRGARAALALLLAAALGPGPARPHPQCLDFKPPFRPPRGLAFCRRYADFGCCDPRRDRALLQRFYRLSARLDGPTYAACAGHLQDLLCQVRRRGTVWHGTARRGTARLPHGAAAAPGAPAAQRGGGGDSAPAPCFGHAGCSGPGVGASAPSRRFGPGAGASSHAGLHQAQVWVPRPRHGCVGPGGCTGPGTGTLDLTGLREPGRGHASPGTPASTRAGPHQHRHGCFAQPRGARAVAAVPCPDGGTGTTPRVHQPWP